MCWSPLPDAEPRAAGKDSVLLSFQCLTSEDGTSSTCRGMGVSPLHRALLAPAAVSSPAPRWSAHSGLRLLSRTLGPENRTPSIAFGHHMKECKWPICGQCHFTTSNTSWVCGRNLRWPFRGAAASLYGHRRRGSGTSAQGPFPPTAKLFAFQIPTMR